MENDYKKANIFTEEGRILQVEYAIKNVSNAGTIISVICTDGILLLGLKKGTPSLYREKIYPLSDDIYCAVSGSFADCLKLVGFARLKSQEITDEFGISCPIETISKKIGELKQSMTQMGGMRPFGVSILYAGYSNLENSYVLYSTDPSGTINQWTSVAYGENEEVINNALKNNFVDTKYNLQESTLKVMEIISSVREVTEKEAEVIEILHYSTDKKRYLDKNEVSGVIAELAKNKK
ncbi:hypothetical protein H312_00339 [Anncaliia algerae PRA339]|uniref:Proteasome alpha-type subunits domain-containing protein n=1 Tax=Anncaliia algerae PRA339 TaxID=1288291 RepID=A0A059F5R7_9MICR|nr:hypothetical protein H312_00339 [Anncaliia algerae PRA339]